MHSLKSNDILQGNALLCKFHSVYCNYEWCLGLRVLLGILQILHEQKGPV